MAPRDNQRLLVFKKDAETRIDEILNVPDTNSCIPSIVLSEMENGREFLHPTMITKTKSGKTKTKRTARESRESRIERLQHKTNDKVYLTCAKAFRDHYALTRHKKTHSGAKQHYRYICNNKIHGPSHLRDHMLIHKGKLDSCVDCSKLFSQKKVNLLLTKLFIWARQAFLEICVFKNLQEMSL